MRKRPAALMLLVPLAVLMPLASGRMFRDRDHDHLPDKWEKRYHISTHQRSTKRDPDHDRLTNLREYKAHTNPRRADTDRDGLNDRLELVRYKTNPRRADTDGDGISDGAEVRAGTNPRDRSSVPRIPSAPAAAPVPTTPAPPGEPDATCANPAKNVPDGHDRWGGCFPGPSTTGVPDGTKLTPYTGPCSITEDDTVIDNKTVDCDLEVRAGGLIVRNSQVNGSVWIDGPDAGASATVIDSTIDAGPVSDTTTRSEAIGSARFTAIRVEMVRGRSGGWCEYYCEVRDSWIHGQDYDESGHVHFSGMRQGSGALPESQKLIHNTIACDVKASPPDGGCSADVTGYGDFATIQNNLVEKNLLLTSQDTATCAYGGSSKSKPFPDGANNVWRDNIFQRGPKGPCGQYFTMSDLDAGQRGNQWIQNHWNTGELMPLPND
jgi:Bacterial TSP3 repeat